MELPNLLRIGYDKLAGEYNINQLKEASASLTEKYKNESGHGKRLVTTVQEAAAYALVRMPATYGSVFSALKHTFENFSEKICTMLDIGSGTGACAWAISEILNKEISITCMEREAAMISTGKKLAAENPLLRQTQWIQSDFVAGDFDGSYDLVIASYALNELSENDRADVVRKLWNISKKILVIIEPGTPVGFAQLKAIRSALTGEGAHVTAPCPHSNECPLPDDDWCHFTCRIPRTKIHRMLKNAQVPYEDEKFAYLALSKNPPACSPARILRHPHIESGKITLKLCTPAGIVSEIYTKKNKNNFKAARKSDSGDSFTEWK